jgi:sugar/nucleoside kinase (ribokinase family)
MPGSRPLIFGPAYLDRVVRVDRPLVDPEFSRSPLDGSVDGHWLEPGEGLTLVDPLGNRLVVELPDDWPGPFGTVGLSRTLANPPGGWSRTVRALAWQDDLGGMGAGYAATMSGELISALGPENDPNSRKITSLLAKAGVSHQPIRVEGKSADWTLLITSGEHGDKLPIGFRGCHAALATLGHAASEPSPLRVVASLPNRLAREALQGPSTIRTFAPALRNMLDRDPPISVFAEFIDILACNRGEWEQLADREQVAWQLSILVVTDGPNGATLRYTTPEGEAERLQVPAFPRSHPPLDTNRAGEAFASALMTTLIENGWTPGSTVPDLARLALERASAAAALVIGRLDFGFPTASEIDEAIRAGRV